MEALSDEEIREEADSLRERARDGESLDDLLPEAFALTREASRRTHRAAPLRRAADRRHGPPRRRDRRDAHRRGQDPDRDPAGLPQHPGRRQRPPRHRQRLPGPPRRGMDDADLRGARGHRRRRSRTPTTTTPGSVKYACDVTYGTNSEFGFDYLRDNMSPALEQCVQRGHNFAIVDEVDNILIDEARTPLIISGAPEQAAQTYYTFARLAKQLVGVPAKEKLKSLGESKDTSDVDYDYEYDEKHKTVAPTERGVKKAEEFLGVDNLYLGEHGSLVNHLSPGAEGRVALQEGQGLRGDRRRGDDHRRVHRPHPRGPALVGGPAPGGRGEGGRGDPRGEPDPGDDHPAELLPPLRQALRDDRHRPDRGDRVHEDLQDAGGRGPDQPADGPRATRTTRSSRPKTASGRRCSTRSSAATRRASRSWSGPSRSRSRR